VSRRCTADLPGAGGAAKITPEDFEVEELPAYLPSGEGPHTFLWVEKRGRETREVVRALARALSVPEPEVGTAGQKDRQALTRQWFSVPGADPAKALAVEGDGFRVLEARRHGNKLRVGHLTGNRFRILLRGVPDGGLERARAVAAALAVRGLPNFYGAQRFGRSGDNAEVGAALLRGEPDRRIPRDRTTRRLLVSAFQSDVFNRVLAHRMQEGSWDRPEVGDVLEKLASGGRFLCEAPDVDLPRVQGFECSVTGPMPGHRVRPAPQGRPAQLEAELLAASGVTPEHLQRSRDAEGTRRALRIPVRVDVEPAGPEVLRLAFELPAGSYATVVLGEISG
jgi:tRNA pseudouridine13 synthase